MIEFVQFSNSALKDLRRLEQQTAFKIVQALRDYAQTEVGDVKGLKGTSKPAFRLRVGDYRIVFIMLNNRPLIIEVVEIVKRGDAYKKKSRKRLK
jgi:mRNA interferase RelE/StbE